MLGYFLCLFSSIILFGMALLQLSLVFGAPFGEYVLGGKYRVLPKKMRIVSVIFTIIFLISGLMYLEKGSILDLNFNDILVNIIIIANTLFYGYAIIWNGILTKSKKERIVMTPFSIIQFILSICVLIFV